MNYFALAFKAARRWSDIRDLVVMLEPAIVEINKVWPKASPLVQSLWKDLGPEFKAGAPAPKEDYDVKWLQNALNKLTGSHLKVDGDYGEATKAAVEKFQRAHGLEADGWAGVETSAAMYHELAQRT